MEDPKPVNSKKIGKLMVILLIITLIIVIVVLAVLLLRPDEEETSVVYEREVTAKIGQLEGKTEAEIQEELNRVIEEGMFHVAINNYPVFEDGESEGNLKIENVPSNHYLMRVEIRLEDTNELVYSTKFIEPNNHIQSGKLDVDLDAGSYFAVATFYAYDPETLTEMGSVSSLITIYILN